jgi:hypothetical protein
MKINLVIRDDWGWALKKIAIRLKASLEELGNTVTIRNTRSNSVDINHFLFNTFVPSEKIHGSSLFLTHIDSVSKANHIADILKHFIDVGICMSDSHLEELVKFGIPREKLTFCLPAVDKIDSNKITFVILSNKYRDGRKNEWMLRELARKCDLSRFKFIFHGIHWGDTIKHLREFNIEAEWISPTDDTDFDYKLIFDSLNSSHYYLYLGWDEGSLGSLDAYIMRKKLIVSAQGFHLNLPARDVAYFNNFSELLGIFRSISNDEDTFELSLRNMDWKRYAIEHLAIWQVLVSQSGTFTDLKPINNYSTKHFEYKNRRSILPNGFRRKAFKKLLKLSTLVKTNRLLAFMLRKFS